MTKEAKRPVGRPRADGGAHLTPDVLLNATSKLVARNGYTGTSFRMIAKELDVTIASIFHLYPSKEKLLNALISYAAQGSLAFYEEVNQLDAPPSAKLFKSIAEEFRIVSSVDRDHVAIFYLPELRRPEFAAAQKVRAQMVDHYARLIAAGVSNGSLTVANIEWCAEQFFQLTETSIIAGTQPDAKAVDQLARGTARLCLRAVLTDPADLDAIETTSNGFDISIKLD